MVAPLVYEVLCPDCQTLLRVDAATGAVLSHEKGRTPPPVKDLDEAKEIVKQDPTRRDNLFHQSLESEKSKSDRLKKSFEDALRRTQANPGSPRPTRDIDLD